VTDGWITTEVKADETVLKGSEINAIYLWK
jgi:hypothetical protein